MTSKNQKIFIALLIFIFLSGALVRLFPLDSHFAHIDDLGVAKTVLNYQQNSKTFAPVRILKNPVLMKLYEWSGVARHWTYAPLQFVLTYYLIHPGQTYREILFWGRLPSFLFGCLGLLMLLWFYRRHDRLRTPAGLLALTFLAFSWENIIYAQQMESYAIGVFSSAAVLLLFWEGLNKKRFLFSDLLLLVVYLAILSYTQYQILFFMPAFLVTLFIYYAWKNRHDILILTVRFTAGVLCFALLIFPLYFFFLLKKQGPVGITWNVGPHQEFQFLLPQGASLWGKISYCAFFFAKNTFIVFNSMLAFIPENHPLFFPVSVFLAFLFLLGIYSFVRTPVIRKKFLGLFFLLSSLTWAWLVIRNKIALSPTRHSLILLPFMAVIAAEGWGRFINFFHRNHPLLRLGLTGGFWGALTILFFLSFHPVISERADPFHEGELRRLFEDYHVEGIMATDFTVNLSLMPSIMSRFNYFESETMETPLIDSNVDFRTIAFVSHRVPLTRENFNMMRFKVNLRQKMQGKNHFITGEMEDYKIVYSKEIKSDTEIEFSRRTRNGTNNLFLYILQRI